MVETYVENHGIQSKQVGRRKTSKLVRGTRAFYGSHIAVCRRALGCMLYLPIRIKVYADTNSSTIEPLARAVGLVLRAYALPAQAVHCDIRTLHMFYGYKEYIMLELF